MEKGEKLYKKYNCTVIVYSYYGIITWVYDAPQKKEALQNIGNWR